MQNTALRLFLSLRHNRPVECLCFYDQPIRIQDHALAHSLCRIAQLRAIQNHHLSPFRVPHHTENGELQVPNPPQRLSPIAAKLLFPANLTGSHHTGGNGRSEDRVGMEVR